MSPVQVSQFAEKGVQRPRLPTVGEGGYSSGDPPPVAGLDPRESTSHSWDTGSLWVNASTRCVARYSQGTWQGCLFLMSESCLATEPLQSRLVSDEKKKKKKGTGVLNKTK